MFSSDMTAICNWDNGFLSARENYNLAYCCPVVVPDRDVLNLTG